MNQENKHKAIASTITVFSMSVILLILFFCGMEHQNPPPQPKKSIIIELDFDTGGGGGGGNESAPTPTRTPQPSGEHVATQDFEDAPAASSSPIKEAADTKPKVNQNALFRPGSGGGSGGGSGTGSGSGRGDGLGPGTGSGSGGGLGYGTGGRGYRHMPDVSLKDRNGVVFVEVHVNEAGDVIDAKVISNAKYPTTITDRNILNNCVLRAKTAKYAPGKEELRVIIFKR